MPMQRREKVLVGMFSTGSNKRSRNSIISTLGDKAACYDGRLGNKKPGRDQPYSLHRGGTRTSTTSLHISRRGCRAGRVDTKWQPILILQSGCRTGRELSQAWTLLSTWDKNKVGHWQFLWRVQVKALL